MIRRATLLDVESIVGWIIRDFPEGDEETLTAAYTDAIANNMNVCLCVGEGGAIFLWRGPGIYEMHCFFEQRGAVVREIIKAILAMMVKYHRARIVWAAIPEASRKVKACARWVGFNSVEHAVLPHGPCEIFTWENSSCHQ